MKMKQEKFNGVRLKEAMQLREKKMTELARKTGSASSHCRYMQMRLILRPQRMFLKLQRLYRFLINFL